MDFHFFLCINIDQLCKVPWKKILSHQDPLEIDIFRSQSTEDNSPNSVRLSKIAISLIFWTEIYVHCNWINPSYNFSDKIFTLLKSKKTSELSHYVLKADSEISIAFFLSDVWIMKRKSHTYLHLASLPPLNDSTPLKIMWSMSLNHKIPKQTIKTNCQRCIDWFTDFLLRKF